MRRCLSLFSACGLATGPGDDALAVETRTSPDGRVSEKRIGIVTDGIEPARIELPDRVRKAPSGEVLRIRREIGVG